MLKGLDSVLQDIVRESGAMLKSTHLSASEIHEKNGPATSPYTFNTDPMDGTTNYEMKLQPYDYAVASVIIEEAGGRISRVDGSSITLEGLCSIVGGTETAWIEVRAMIAQPGFAEA